MVPEETGREHAASPSGEPSVVMGQAGRAESAQGVTTREEPFWTTAPKAISQSRACGSGSLAIVLTSGVANAIVVRGGGLV